MGYQKHIDRTRRAFIAAAVAAALVPAPAWSDFGAPVTISAVGQLPRVGVDSDGDAVVVWKRGTRIQARALSAAGVVGPTQTLTDAADWINELAVNAGGDALITWTRNEGLDEWIEARSRSSDGVLGPVQILSNLDPSPFDQAVAMNADGDAVIVWKRGSRIQGRARTSSGVLGPIQTFSAAAGGRVREAQVVVDADGDALIAWLSRDDGGDRLYARTRTAGGVLGPIRRLSGRSEFVQDFDMAGDGSGHVLIVWEGLNQTANRRQIQLRAATTGGNVGALQRLSDTDRNAILPRVARDGEGNALVIWQVRHRKIVGRDRFAGGGLGPIENYTRRGASFAQVAAAADGSSVIAWQERDGRGKPWRIKARTRSAAGVLGPVQTLPPDKSDPFFYRLAVSADGKAVIVWDDLLHVQAAVGP